MAERSELLGLEFERAGMTGVVARCLAWCQGPRTSHIVVTANASHLCMMRRDGALRQACQAADLAVADGMSVVWALKLLGRPVPERVAGIDLMTRLLEAGEFQHRQALVVVHGENGIDLSQLDWQKRGIRRKRTVQVKTL